MNGKKEMNAKIRTLLADDHAITRMGLKSVLDMCPDIAVVGEAEDGADAVRRTKALAPDVVVMDLMMPGMDGTEATRALAQEVPSARVLILTTFGTADGIAHALEAGAVGAVMKNIRPADLAAAIRDVHAGRRVLSPEIEQMLKDNPPVPELSARQVEILDSVVRGLTNEDIAAQFGISPRTVKDHLNVLFAKLGASTRTEAAAIALRRHLLKA